MQIAGLQKLTLIDFPGEVAATVFTRGCNFRCPFCHNPELVVPQKFSPQLETSDIFAFFENRRGKLSGVCLTGGEPLLQPDLPEFIQELRAMGYKVKLDTNGFLPEELQKLLDQQILDYVAMDIKGPAQVYAQVSPFYAPEETMTRIRQSIALIIHSGLPYEFRTTVVKPLHKVEDFYLVGDMLSGAQRYALQNFVLSKHVGPAEMMQGFLRQELETMQVIMQGYVGEVLVR